MNDPLGRMDAQQTKLYQRIQRFSLDQPEAPLSFSKRLARDNGWSWNYAQRVIEEYKRFVFLAIAAGHPVTPSDQVDQVWHLHLSYTRSYWQEFCPKVLQTPLHHEPTRGGSSEQTKFDDWYGRTLESYERFWGQAPPVDIWSAPKDRFGRDLHFVRVNTQKNWLVPKLSLRALLILSMKFILGDALRASPKINFIAGLSDASLSWIQVQPLQVQLQQSAVLAFGFALTFAIAGCQAANLPNPLDFRGAEFLTFYLLLSTAVIILAACLRAFLRLPNGDPKQRSVSLDIYETAYLAEGKSRVVDTAIATLVQKDYVTVESGQSSLTLNQPVEEVYHPMERAVVDAIALDGRLVKVRSAATQATHAIQDRLCQLELLVHKDQSSKAQTYPALLIAALFGLGIAKIAIGLSRGKPVGFLIMMSMVVAIIGLAFWRNPVRRSRYGDRVFQSLQGRVRSTVVNPADPQLPLTFALWGASVLPNEMVGLKQLLIPVSAGGGGGEGGYAGGDSGGGDSGGGGCGGCGGCGGGD